MMSLYIYRSLKSISSRNIAQPTININRSSRTNSSSPFSIQLDPRLCLTHTRRFSLSISTYVHLKSTEKFSLHRNTAIFQNNANLDSQTRPTTSNLQQRKYNNVLLVCKPNDKRVKTTLEILISYLAKQHPEVRPVVEEELLVDDDLMTDEHHHNQRGIRRDQIDLVIALGGDGTVLHISHLFKNTPCPPILGFNFGTIGFLLHFAPIDKFEVITQVLDGQIEIEDRMRLDCFTGNKSKKDQTNLENSTMSLNNKIHCESSDFPRSLVDLSAINEVSLHRTGCPHMVAVNIYIQGRFLTQAVADGLIVATPTGSTAYSCSAGGSIVYPTMQAILVTPICPRSLSFRPLILPPSLSVQLTLDPSSRSTAELRVDGINIKPIRPGESVEIRASKHPIQLFSPPSPTHCVSNDSNILIHDYWIDDLNMMLNFNRSYQPKDPPPTKEFGSSSVSCPSSKRLIE